MVSIFILASSVMQAEVVIIIIALTYVTPTLKFLHHLSIVIALNSRDLSRVYIVQPGPLLFACVSQHTALLVCVSKESFSSLVESVGQGGLGG